MKSIKILIIAIIAVVIVLGVGLWATGSLNNDQDLNGQEVHIAAAASLKNVYDEKLIPMFEKEHLE